MVKNRKIVEFLDRLNKSDVSRITVLTGARQTGKTTLAKSQYPQFSFISIEDPVTRSQYTKLTAKQWQMQFGNAVLDEIQKEPLLIESIKAVYDQFTDTRYVLTGSSQLLLLEKVRESLAGRCLIVELFPLTLPELQSKNWHQKINNSCFQDILQNPDKSTALAAEMLPFFTLDSQYAEKFSAWQHYKNFGGYPALANESWNTEERHLWLKNYIKTYLERDIRDLASFRDLAPFIKLQKYLALQTAQTINASSIATQMGISAKTVQQYIKYFELSYQIILLPAWSRNQAKRLAKAPKFHYLDNGVLQAVLQKQGGINGSEFESLVVSELYKQAKCIQSDCNFFHLRTLDGLEVDLLIELPQGYLAFEIKMAERVGVQDARHLKKLSDFLDKPLLHSFVLSNDSEKKELAEKITAIHAAQFLA